MNYIIHLNKTFATFCEDERLTPFHISLYFALFQYWNIAKFRNPISISRDEIMRACKIGSVNTYIRSIKELHEWKYIQYKPSYSPLVGSQVHMFNFDNADNKTKHNGNTIPAHNSTKKTVEKTTKKATETQLRPSINSSNNLNKTNKSKPKKYGDHQSKNNKELLRIPRKENDTGRKETKQKEKSCAKKVEAEGRNPERKPREKVHALPVARFQRPLLSQVKTYFGKSKWPHLEAQKFFNYYSSNGWLIGGKTPMQDWKAAAGNWMLNKEKFNHDKEKGVYPERSRRAGKLSASTSKDYAEPL